MTPFRTYTMNVGGHLLTLDRPMVMGILNLTPDSFYSDSRKQTDEEIRTRVEQLLTEGADMIDVGAYSSRPGADDVSVEEEMRRLRHGLGILREAAPGAVVSVDTFRADVAAMCVEEYGVAVVNDISAGEWDNRMARTVARLRVPYIIMHAQGTPQTMQLAPRYDDVEHEVLTALARRVDDLHGMGIADIIVDPGFGFGKTLEHNYRLMERLGQFHLLECPLLVGVSRKSMVCKLLGITPDESLNGTTALHTVALMKGAHILRVHDVEACRQCVGIVSKLRESSLLNVV